mmetsp:Transcript_67886/g.107722  ORF Transcript_67886/g.107722 Transcript_67886/m.107722 type:complete len:233 (-) Transcript_67886:720-1418(-)
MCVTCFDHTFFHGAFFFLPPSNLDFDSQLLNKLLHQLGVRRPCGTRYQSILVFHFISKRSRYRLRLQIFRFAHSHHWRARWISGGFPSVQYSRRSQHQYTMANLGNHLLLLGKVLNDLNHILVNGQIFRRSSTRNIQTIILVQFAVLQHIVKGSIESEIMSWFLGVRLIAFEIVHARFDRVVLLLVGAHHVHLDAKGQQHLKDGHHLIVFHVVSSNDQHFAFLACVSIHLTA